MNRLSNPKSIVFFSSLIYLFLMALTGCSKDENYLPTDGTLTGTILAWDDKTKLVGDNSGITVSIDYPISLSTTTDAAGKFSFPSLPFDKYDISISKAGYGTYRIFSFGHNYNPNTPETVNTIPIINFAKSASTTITKLQLSTTSFNGVAGVSFFVTVSPVPTTLNRAYFRYFLSTSPSVSSTNYMAYTPVIGSSVTTTTDGFSNDELTGFGFVKGQTIYIKGYGESVRGNDYDDPNQRMRVFPNLNATSPAPISFVMQ